MRSRSRRNTGERRRVLAVLLAVVLLAGLPVGCRSEPLRPVVAEPWPGGVSRPQPWQWQLRGPLDPTVEAEVFLLDPVRTTAAETADLRSRGRRLICLVSAGAYTGQDPDAARFPAAVRGRTGAPRGGTWLDVRQWNVLEPVIADRLRLCRGKRFEAVAFTAVDGYAHRSGFALDFDAQLGFNRRLAALARALALSPGLVNNVAQVAALAPDFDFAVNEECVRLRQCARLLPFTEAGKPVLHVEYAGTTADFCVTTVGYGFASMRKQQALDAWRAPCAY